MRFPIMTVNVGANVGDIYPTDGFKDPEIMRVTGISLLSRFLTKVRVVVSVKNSNAHPNRKSPNCPKAGRRVATANNSKQHCFDSI